MEANTKIENNQTDFSNSDFDTGQSIGLPVKQEGIFIVLCLSGNAILEINDESFPINRGELGVVLQGKFSRVRNLSHDFSSLEIIVPETILKEHFLDVKNFAIGLSPLAKSPVLKMNEQDKEDFINLLNLCKKLNKQGCGLREKCVINVYISLLYFVCGISKEIENFPGREIEGGERQYQYFNSFLELVAEHCCNERHVKFYADKLFITPKYLSSLIKTVSGRTAHSWIDEFVIAEAKQRLKFSGKSVQEISWQLNFSTQSFFGKYFKRLTGMSPVNYKCQVTTA